MARTLHQMLPDRELLLRLEPEELAGDVLEYLNSLGPEERGQLNRHNFSLPHTVQGYPPPLQDRIRRALMAAWSWLAREGFIAADPVSGGLGRHWGFVTRPVQR